MFASFTTISPKDKNNDANSNSWKNYTPAQEETPYSAPAPTAEPAPATTRAQQLSRNVLNSDVEVIGKLFFSDDLLIDGTVEGEISSEGVLSIGEHAIIKAEIKTKSVIIHGKVTGNITVTDRVELKSTAELVGDIVAASLAIEAGAKFIGHSTVGAPAVNISSTPSPAKSDAPESADNQPTLDMGE